MPTTYTQLLVHVVFSTKKRKPLLTASIQDRLYPYRGGIVRAEKCSLLAVGGIEDHIHLLIRQRADLALSDLIRTVKSQSSKWIHERFPELKAFAWQEGYGGFSVSRSGREKVKAYVLNQKQHHRRRDFKTELIALLAKHDIEYDARYLFD